MLTQRTPRSLTRYLSIWLIASLVAGAALTAFTHPGSTFVLNRPNTVHAAPNTPTYSYSLSPTSATTSTFEVKLTISNCMGVAPPSSSWYGPSGPVSQTCSGSPNIVREYVYISGSLFQVIDHFYISPCNREPGSYRVEVGGEYTGYFSIASSVPPTSNLYLPMLMRDAWDEAPAAFDKLFPTNGMDALSPYSLMLDWENSRGTTAYAYCYDTSEDNACSNWVETGTTSLANLEGLSESTTYYWQVRATNSLGTTHANGGESAYWSFTTGEPLADTWTEMTAAADWSTRDGHTSVTLPDGSIVVMGGTGIDNEKLNDVWRSTNQGAIWALMTAAAAWSARSAHTSVALPDGSIVLMGGYDGSSREDDVWRSTDQGATWVEMTDDAPWAARNAHTSVALPDGSIVLMAGYTGSSYRNDVWRSTDLGATWTQMTAAAEWAGRTSATSLALPDGSIVLMAGFTGSTSKNDVWRSTDRGATWTQMTAAAGWAARTSTNSLALRGGSIMLMGGYSSSYENDVWLSTDMGATWTEMTASAEWSARRYHTTGLLTDGSVVLIGGFDGAKLNDVWRLAISGE